MVIVSYRAKYFLEQTIRAAQEALHGHESEIFVVDNNGGDETLPFMKARFPEVHFIANASNVGFGRANNQAIMQCHGEFTIILNPDTIITPHCISQPLQWMQSHSDCGAIGLHMVDGNGVFLPESKRAFPTPWVSFCKIFGLSSLFPRSRWFAKYHLRYLNEWTPHQVDILSGAYMFCRTKLLQKLKGFDEDFFMYGEDIDLSYRIKLAGFKNWYLPVNMIHYKGESTKKDSLRYVRVFYEAMLIFYRKHFPGFGRVAYPFIKLGVGVRQAMSMTKRVFMTHAKGENTSDRERWVVLSKQARQVARQAGIAHFETAIPSQGLSNVLIDDASYSYREMVDMIAKNARQQVFFHIFSSRNGVVITPKMQD